ncbi:MAG: hypothetical protein KAS30_05785, partial [Candidatus Diapherotrites archaeon]|nr:hypothetical protein [Candidatus Diapherotrites archaeon]
MSNNKTIACLTATMLLFVFFASGVFAEDWGITNVTFNTSFLYETTPSSTLIDDPISIDPQLLVDGWHKRNFTFDIIFESPLYQQPTNEIGDAIEVTPEFLSSSFHQRNNTFY